MVTTQAAVTIMSDILPGHEVPLRQLLETANQDPANNALVPFGQLPTVHFARFFLMDATQDLQGQPLTPRSWLSSALTSTPVRCRSRWQWTRPRCSCMR